MIACGVNLNLNNLQGELTTQLNGFVNLSGSLGSLGTPDGLAQLQSLLGPSLTSIRGKLESLIPEVPTVPQSLRNDLAELFALPAGGTAALAKIATFVQDYTGLQNIAGFANLNLNDLASSVFSVTGTFDPCNPSINIPDLPDLTTIPNIIKNPLTGALEQLPDIQPDLGATVNAIRNVVEDQTITDNLAKAVEDNIKIVSAITPNELDLILTQNVQTAVTGMGDVIKKLPSGEEIVETKETFITEVKKRAPVLKDKIPEIIPEASGVLEQLPALIPTGVLGSGQSSYTDELGDYFIMPSGAKRYLKRIHWETAEYRAARRKALKDYKAETGLKGGKLLVAFNKEVTSGKISDLNKFYSHAGKPLWGAS